MSQITTHVLDTSIGKPAAGINVVLYRAEKEEWTEIGRSKTNADGRIPDLLPKEMMLKKCTCKLRFETKEYFDNNKVSAFYPFVEIVFSVESADHYHVPLLLNPFGYSTYRGS